MGEQHTYRPLISLTDGGQVQFEFEQEGMFCTFDIDIDDVDRIIERLKTAKDIYYGETK